VVALAGLGEEHTEPGIEWRTHDDAGVASTPTDIPVRIEDPTAEDDGG
jgi:hypothetical protein